MSALDGIQPLQWNGGQESHKSSDVTTDLEIWLKKEIKSVNASFDPFLDNSERSVRVETLERVLKKLQELRSK